MSEKQQEIQTRCPSCGSRSLFIGAGGHLTCSWLECPEPGVATAIAALKELLSEAMFAHKSGWFDLDLLDRMQDALLTGGEDETE